MMSEAYAFSDDEEQAERQEEEALSKRSEREAVGNRQAADPGT